VSVSDFVKTDKEICVKDERIGGGRRFNLSFRYISLLSTFTSITMG